MAIPNIQPHMVGSLICLELHVQSQFSTLCDPPNFKEHTGMSLGFFLQTYEVAPEAWEVTAATRLLISF